MLVVGDKIKQVKPVCGFDKVGTVFDVVGIENGAISFKAGFGIGMMSWNEFNEHFEKVDQPEIINIKHVWTDWAKIRNDAYGDYEFKTNGKKVIVKKFGFKAEATCHPNDMFNQQLGIRIALKRINIKKAKSELEEILRSA